MKKVAVHMLSWGFALAAGVALTPNAEAASAGLAVRAHFTRAPRVSEIRSLEAPAVSSASLARSAEDADAATRYELNVGDRSVTVSFEQSATAKAKPITVVHYDYH